jgi:hypothetical protein
VLLPLHYKTAACADMNLIPLEQMSHSICVMGTDIVLQNKVIVLYFYKFCVVVFLQVLCRCILVVATTAQQMHGIRKEESCM